MLPSSAGGGSPVAFAMKAKRPTGFLNVDLEIESRLKLDRLAVEFGKSLWVLYCGAGEGKGTHLLVMESSAFPATPEATIRELVAAVEGLSASGRRLWDRARRRTFDVGYELPAGTRRVLWSIEPKVLDRISQLRARLVFTCYRAPEGEQDASGNAVIASCSISKQRLRRP